MLEAQGNGDKAYDALIDDVLNHKAIPPGHIAHPTAMHVFLLRQAGLPISGDVAAAMGTPANLLAMRDARNSPQIRIEAADRIIRTGAASVAELKVLAEAGDIPADRLATALSDAPNLPFFVGQVLLRRAAQLETRPDAKAQLVFSALSLGEKAELLPLAAGLQGDIVASIKPMPAKHDMAHLFARALLLAGVPDAAERWLSDKDAMSGAIDLVAPNPARDAKAQAHTCRLCGRARRQSARRPMPTKPIRHCCWASRTCSADRCRPTRKRRRHAIEAQTLERQTSRRPCNASKRASLKPERKGEALLLILSAVQSTGLRDMAPDVTIELVRLLGEMDCRMRRMIWRLEALALYVPPPPPRLRRLRNEPSGDAPLIEAFLDMMSAERGASVNTLAAYRRDLLDFHGHLARNGADAKHATRDHVKSYLARLSSAVSPARPRRAGFRLCASSSAFSIRTVSAADDPTTAVDAPKRGRPLPKIAVARRFGAVDRGGHQRRREKRRGRAPAVHLGDALRLGFAHFGTGDATARGRAQPGRRTSGERQGQQGTHGAAQSARARGHRELSWRCAKCSCRAANAAATPRNSCFPHAPRNAI